MSTRTVLGAVGAIIGAYFGNAQLGWAIGSAIGGAIDPEIIKGPSIGDIANQTSQEGVPRPIVFALSQPIAGNIIASGEPEIVRRRQSQGKSGPKVETESVYRTYAIGVCEGPITRFVRVWRNNQLVYDVSDHMVLQHIDNFNFNKNARYFLGTYDQNPSPDLEAEFGVGTTPAHRGTAYLVMADEDLTDFRGAIPQFVFQVERCEGEFYTSRVYPVNDTSAIVTANTVAPKFQPNVIEPILLSGDLVGGVLDEILRFYDDGEPDALEVTGNLVGGDIDVTGFLEYEDGEPEAIDVSGDIVAGVLDVALIVYEEYPPEAIDLSGDLISGTLT